MGFTCKIMEEFVHSDSWHETQGWKAQASEEARVAELMVGQRGLGRW